MKNKRLISGVLALTLVMGAVAMPVAGGFSEVVNKISISAGAENAVELPEGYTTNEHGIMAIKYSPTTNHPNNYGFKGYFGDTWKTTTYNDYGFFTFYKNSNGETEYINADSTAQAVTIQDGVSVKTDLTFAGGGKYVKTTYTITNDSSSAVNYSLGSYADVQIGNDDYAPVTDITDENGNFQGYTMRSRYGVDKNEDGEYAQFNIFLSNLQGATNVDTHNISAYSPSTGDEERLLYRMETAFSNENYSKNEGEFDSVIGFAWQDRTIGANETQQYSIYYGVGGFESEIAALSDNTDIAIPDGSTLVLENDTVTDSFKPAKESTVIDVLTFDNATYQLFADEECTTLLADNTMPLTIGENKAYILVTAEDGVSTKVYPVIIQNDELPDSSSEAQSSSDVSSSTSSAKSSAVKDGNPKTGNGALPLSICTLALVGAVAVTVKRKEK